MENISEKMLKNLAKNENVYNFAAFVKYL